MKKIMMLTLIALMIAPAIAQKKGPKPNYKANAKRVIAVTQVVIHKTKKAVKENKVYTGNLAKAIRHQRFARKLFAQGKYIRAMHQSRRARYFAKLAYAANKGADSDDMNFSKEDDDLMNTNPVNDTDLDNEMMKDDPNGPTKDEDVVGLPDEKE
jgi:hypothetical protein